MQAVIIMEHCMHDPEMCMAIPVCPTGALHYEESAEGLPGRMAVDYDLCDGCGSCAEVCCGEAIVLREVPAASAARH